MTTVVVSSLLLCVIFVITGFVFVWFDKDVSSILPSALTVFGTELGICGAMTIFKRWCETQDQKKHKENMEDVIDG